MRRRRHNLRPVMLVWKHPRKFCSVLILAVVFLMIYLSTRDTDRIDNTSSINFQRRFIQLFDADQRTNNINSIKGSRPTRPPMENKGEKRLKQEIHHQVKYQLGDSHQDRHDNRQHKDSVRQNQHQIVQRKNISTQDHDNQDHGGLHDQDHGGLHDQDHGGLHDQDHDGLHDQDHGGLHDQDHGGLHDHPKKEVIFTPEMYPMDVNMTDILRQHHKNGYANEQPINSFDYRYIISPDQTCYQPDSVRVLFIVKSKPEHFLRRVTIRETWGDRKRFPSIRTIFSSGIPKNSRLLLNLQEESVTYNDILLVDYAESYYNLTLKTITGLKWAVTHCARAKYVLSIDDDVYVAPDLLLSFLNRPSIKNEETVFSGHLLVNTEPIRNVNSKWQATKSEYPFKTYPKYIFGGFVIMSMSTVRDFTIAAMYTKLFKFEDVYLGILAAKIGIEATNNGYVNSRKTFTVSESFKTLIASHYYYDPKDLQRAWDCHLSILDQDDEKAIFCDYIGDRLRKIQSEINNIVGWMEAVKLGHE